MSLLFLARATVFAHELIGSGQLHIPVELRSGMPRVSDELVQKLVKEEKGDNVGDFIKALERLDEKKEFEIVPFDKNDDPSDIFCSMSWLLNESADRDAAVGIILQNEQDNVLCVCGVENSENYIGYDANTGQMIQFKRPTFELIVHLDATYGRDCQWKIVQLIESSSSSSSSSEEEEEEKKVVMPKKKLTTKKKKTPSKRRSASSRRATKKQKKDEKEKIEKDEKIEKIEIKTEKNNNDAKNDEE